MAEQMTALGGPNPEDIGDTTQAQTGPQLASTALEGPSTQAGLALPGLELSDQEDTMEGVRGELGEIADEAGRKMEGVEKGEIGYERPGSEDLIGGSGIEKGTSYIDPEGTVEKQLSDLIDSDSQYMQLAEKRAQEKAASMGLLGSSMAVGAAHRAAIEKALPIAQQDAKTYATAMLEEQKTKNEMSRMIAESDLSALAREHAYDIDTEKLKFNKQMDLIADQAKMAGNAELELATTKMKAEWEAQTQEHLKRLDAELTMKMEQQQLDAQERLQATTSASQVMASAFGTINDLMGNADFMAGYAGNPQGLQNVFNNFLNLAKSQVKFIGASSGLNEEWNKPGSGYLELIGGWTSGNQGYKPSA